MGIETQITGADGLTAVLGCWPSFHDAEVLSIRLERSPLDEAPGPDLEALVHTFELTDQVGPDGYLVLRNHVLVKLLFREVDQLKLENFNHQNALLELGIRDIRDRQLDRFRFSVHFVGAHGVEASFLCHAIECASVTPCDENANPPGNPGGVSPQGRARSNPDGRGLQSFPKAGGHEPPPRP